MTGTLIRMNWNKMNYSKGADALLKLPAEDIESILDVITKMILLEIKIGLGISTAEEINAEYNTVFNDKMLKYDEKRHIINVMDNF